MTHKHSFWLDTSDEWELKVNVSLLLLFFFLVFFGLRLERQHPKPFYIPKRDQNQAERVREREKEPKEMDATQPTGASRRGTQRGNAALSRITAILGEKCLFLKGGSHIRGDRESEKSLLGHAGQAGNRQHARAPSTRSSAGAAF